MLAHRSSELITTQSYTVGLLGPTAASPVTSSILDFRRRFLQTSPLGVVPDANGESGVLAGEDGTELDSPRGDGTERDGGRTMVMLRVTAGTTSAAAVEADDEEEREEEYLRSLPRPESGRGPATVSSQSWSRRPMRRAVCDRFRVRMLSRIRAIVVGV